ncbi:MAG: NAD(P)-dependent oxidoreductase [Flavobacteriales bacterium]|nr:NAD(P)-dependent oxidoreductase [Flavobacteriales bacterium]
MILGSGLIASAFRSLAEEPGTLIFASGVSNSTTAKDADYLREQQMLKEHVGITARLVYFSTTSLYDPSLCSTAYILHKSRMEQLVRALFPDHIIFRLPNIIGPGSNPHTLCNHIRDSILARRTLHVHLRACRYLMDVDTLFGACQGMIMDDAYRGMTVNTCFDQPVRIPDLVAAMELALGEKATVAEEERGACYQVDNALFKAHWHAARLGPWPEADDWRPVIMKYYGNRDPSPARS